MLDSFAEDAVYAWWDGEGDETAERVIAIGRPAIHDVLRAGAYGRCEPLVSLRDGSNWFVEGALLGDGGGSDATFVASAQLDRAGAVTRCLAFHCPPVRPSPSWSAGSQSEPAAALTILE